MTEDIIQEEILDAEIMLK